MTVLSDQSKRLMYDAGLYDPLEEEDEVRTVFFFDPAKADLLLTRLGTKRCRFVKSSVVVVPKERHRIF